MVALAFTPVLASVQTPPGATPYDALTAAERGLLDEWAAGAATSREAEARIRQQFNAAPERFRAAFEHATSRLATVLLSDPENGEVLGSALDLIDSVEHPARQPGVGSAATGTQLAVTLAPGARDRLRRSAEFTRAQGGPGTTFRHGNPPAILIAFGDGASRALVTILSP